MKKYRIVKVVSPELTQNYNCEADFIPKIKWKAWFEVHSKESFLSKWKHCHTFERIEQARVFMVYKKLKKTQHIIIE